MSGKGFLARKENITEFMEWEMRVPEMHIYDQVIFKKYARRTVFSPYTAG